MPMAMVTVITVAMDAVVVRGVVAVVATPPPCQRLSSLIDSTRVEMPKGA